MGQRATVLVVEDNDETRHLLERIFVIKGYAIHSVRDGGAALRWLRAGNRPSVVVLDFYLPVIDGETFLREVGSDPVLSHIPVVAFTARSGDRPPGLAAYIRKGSDDPDVLLDAVASCLTA